MKYSIIDETHAVSNVWNNLPRCRPKVVTKRQPLCNNPGDITFDLHLRTGPELHFREIGRSVSHPLSSMTGLSLTQDFFRSLAVDWQQTLHFARRSAFNTRSFDVNQQSLATRGYLRRYGGTAQKFCHQGYGQGWPLGVGCWLLLDVIPNQLISYSNPYIAILTISDIVKRGFNKVR